MKRREVKFIQKVVKRVKKEFGGRKEFELYCYYYSFNIFNLSFNFFNYFQLTFIIGVYWIQYV